MKRKHNQPPIVKKTCVSIITMFILFISFTQSCKREKEKIVSDKYPVKKYEYLVKEIDLTDKNVTKIDSLSFLFKNPKIISLEQKDDSYIGVINKVIVRENSLYILDQAFSKTLWIYNKNGKFNFKISAKGYGPKEFSYISDFTINKKNIVIVDQYLRKILKYDLSGNFISEKKINYFFNECLITNDDKLVLVTGTPNQLPNSEISGDTIINKNIIILNLDSLTIVDSYLDYKDFRDNFKMNKGVDRYKDKNLISPFYDYNLYSYDTRKGLVSNYHINFGKDSLDLKSKSISNAKNIEEIEGYLLQNSNKKYFIDNLSFNSTWLYFTYKTNSRKKNNTLRHDYVHVFYNFNTNKAFEIDNFYKRNNLTDLLLFQFSDITSKNELISFIPAEEYQHSMTKNNSLQASNNLNPIVILLPIRQ